MAVPATSPTYSRREARRLLRITEAQLRSWEKQKLVAPVETYGFRELLAIRTLIKLRKDRVSPQKIRLALHALSRKLKHVSNPLTDLKLYADGKRVRVEIDGRAMEAESGQLLLDFRPAELNRLLEFRAKQDVKSEMTRRVDAEHWFERGLELEHSGAPASQVIEAYQKALEFDPRSAGALVNLGTVFYNARNWLQAEKHYKAAIAVDLNYALAHFDLANLYDERGDRAKALTHYQEALRIAPNYGDAHYNLALLYQGTNQPMKAVRHWTEYLRIDPTSDWSAVARRELSKLRKAAVVGGTNQEL